jgi:ribose-phosphate pyrophosphokinase
MELLITMDAGAPAPAHHRRDPLFGYSRQDRKTDGRTPISAAGRQPHHHSRLRPRRHRRSPRRAVQGFFDKPTDNLFAQPEMAEDILQSMARRT